LLLVFRRLASEALQFGHEVVAETSLASFKGASDYRRTLRLMPMQCGRGDPGTLRNASFSLVFEDSPIDLLSFRM
jgi:hypothetical protein